MAIDAAGDFVITWSSRAGDGAPWTVQAERFYADGTPNGGPFQVGSSSPYDQEYSDVGMDATGDFVIAWESYLASGFANVYAQYYAANGAMGVPYQLNSNSLAGGGYVALAMNPQGDYVVAWSGQNPTGDDTQYLYARTVDAAGYSPFPEFQVDPDDGTNQYFPSVAIDAAGDFTVAWTQLVSGNPSYTSFAQRYDSGSSPLGRPIALGPTGDGRFPGGGNGRPRRSGGRLGRCDRGHH